MPGRSRRARKAAESSRVPVEQGLFLTIGVPEGDKGRIQIKRAAEILQRHGFRVGITSPEAILAAAQLINDDQKKLAEQAAKPTNEGATDDGGDPELA